MVTIAPDVKAAQVANGPMDVSDGSIFGMGLHAKNVDADPIAKLIKLRDNELLHNRPAELCLVTYCRQNWEDWVRNWSPNELTAGIPNQELLIAGFNRVLAACGVSAVGTAYHCFSEIIRRVGPGDNISIKPSTGVTEPTFGYYRASRLALQPVTAPPQTCEKPAVLCFEGQIEKVASLHKVFTWAAESKTPLIVAAFGFGQDVVKTVAANTAAGKFSVLLLEPDQKDDIGHFAISDLAAVSAAQLPDHLPDSFSIESCGSLQSAMVSNGRLLADCDAALLVALGKRIDAGLSELPPAARAIAMRRRNSAVGGRLDIHVPDLGVPGASHVLDELSVILSLWSTFIKEKHIMAPDGLHSVPFHTFVKAARYVDETIKMLNTIGLYVKKGK